MGRSTYGPPIRTHSPFSGRNNGIALFCELVLIEGLSLAAQFIGGIFFYRFFDILVSLRNSQFMMHEGLNNIAIEGHSTFNAVKKEPI
jgi:hypothetical protein